MKDKETKMWLISDTHFSHEKMIVYGRPVDYEEQIKKNLKLMVKPEDTLVHLGDISLGNDLENSNWFKKELGCRTILVEGNHDKKSYGWYIKNGWDFVCREFSGKYLGKKIVFSHSPFLYDIQRYELNIHGHLHNLRHRGDTESVIFKGRIYRLVSMEFLDYKPIMLKNLIEKL